MFITCYRSVRNCSRMSSVVFVLKLVLLVVTTGPPLHIPHTHIQGQTLVPNSQNGFVIFEHVLEAHASTDELSSQAIVCPVDSHHPCALLSPEVSTVAS